MAFWNRKKAEQRDMSLEDILLSSNYDASTISKEQAMQIPALNAGINLISSTVASLPICLYQRVGQQIKPIDDDPRVRMLNGTTGDTLDGFQMKKAVVEDSLIYGAGYIFINKQRNDVASLNYVSNPQVGVAILDPDPIFKSYEFVIYGQTYKDFQLIKLTRKTRDGVTGLGILNEANKILSVTYNTMVFLDALVRMGGNKKGFFKSGNRLTKDAMTELKNAYQRLYANNQDNVMVLNDGIDFQQTNATSVEMQINENMNLYSNEIAKMLSIPSELLNGKVTQFELLYNGFVKLAVMPVIKSFESALNKDLLLEKEKGSFYFAMDTKDLEKFAGNIVQRFQAYQIAINSGIYKVDEVRAMENLDPIGFDFIKLGLADILLNPDTNEIYVPNTNKMVKMGEQSDNTEQPNEPPSAPVVGESPATGDKPSEADKGGENDNEN